MNKRQLKKHYKRIYPDIGSPISYEHIKTFREIERISKSWIPKIFIEIPLKNNKIIKRQMLPIPGVNC